MRKPGLSPFSKRLYHFILQMFIGHLSINKHINLPRILFQPTLYLSSTNWCQMLHVTDNQTGSNIISMTRTWLVYLFLVAHFVIKKMSMSINVAQGIL
jgi:hypothetical protein